jgi:hypothetical protein
MGSDRPGRPWGVTFLRYFLLGIAGALVITGVRFGVVAAMAASQSEAGWRPFAFVLLGLGLPAVWIGTAGYGLLRGHGWSRILVAAMALLATMLFIGAVSKAEREPVQIGATLAALLFTGAAAAYLFSTRTDGWFRRKSA